MEIMLQGIPLSLIFSAVLEPLFFKWEERRIHHDATISVNQRLFEVGGGG
jgi:hypothetical protein